MGTQALPILQCINLIETNIAMSQEINHINCPNCDFEIDVQEILTEQVEDQLEKKYQKKNAELIAKEKAKTKAMEAKLQAERDAIAKKEDEYQDKLDAAISTKVKEEKSKLETKLKKKIQDEQAEVLKSLQNDLDEQSKKVQELNKTKAEVLTLKREKDSLKETLELEAEKKLSEKLVVEREKIQKIEKDKAQFKILEQEKMNQQLTEKINELKRKAEQGSMQLQGEVQELAIEEWLASSFPLDSIEEIKKGAHGADCLQVVNTRNRQNCGTILYESKRTKSFQPAWIEKFKSDIRDKKSTLGVLVTEVMPASLNSAGQIDGVWICTFEEFKILSKALRESVIQLSTALITQDNKGDKMGMLYDFLTGSEFRMQIEAIVTGFTEMETELAKEKRAMTKIWSQREKQINKVINNTVHMYGSIKGIAGSAVQAIPMLELGDED